jgi:hypothetical protein
MSHRTAPSTLSPDQHVAARATLREVALYHRTDVELTDELEERINLAALYQTRLDDGDVTDEDEVVRLRGGIAFELGEAGRLADEIARRQRAARYGYRPTGQPEDDLPTRFARQRDAGIEPLADLIGHLTAQPGVVRSGRWHFRCPFHSAGQERTPSLTVFADGRAHCFACGWHGDGAAFVAELRGIGPVEALRLLEKGLV